MQSCLSWSSPVADVAWGGAVAAAFASSIGLLKQVSCPYLPSVGKWGTCAEFSKNMHSPHSDAVQSSLNGTAGLSYSGTTAYPGVTPWLERPPHSSLMNKRLGISLRSGRSGATRLKQIKSAAIPKPLQSKPSSSHPPRTTRIVSKRRCRGGRHSATDGGCAFSNATKRRKRKDRGI